MIFTELQREILDNLENGNGIDSLVSLEGFTKELEYLEDSGLIKSECKPNPKNSYYSTYEITSSGRRELLSK